MVLALRSARLTRRRARVCGPLAGCAQVRTLEGHRDFVNSVCVTPDGKHVVTGSRDKTARVWRFDDGDGNEGDEREP